MDERVRDRRLRRDVAVEPDEHPALTGFHFRPKFRLAEWPPFPFHVSISFEYAFIKQPGDLEFRQALAITPIFERHIRRFEVSFNPGIEIALKGPNAGSSPVFGPSAKAASRAGRSVWLGVEYSPKRDPSGVSSRFRSSITWLFL